MANVRFWIAMIRPDTGLSPAWLPGIKVARNARGARELLTLVYYGMRDGRIRRAAPPGQAA